MMSRFTSLITSPYRACIKWYLQKPRWFTHKSIKIKILPGVFHPGFFHSTSILLRFLDQQDVKGKTLLELGAGSGLIAIKASSKGAIVTASDISTIAIKNLQFNMNMHKMDFNIVKSDLFDNIPQGQFDFIIINPPYYPATPRSDSDYAWYCGAHHEYFRKLFKQLSNFMNRTSKVIMVLSDVCDLSLILALASAQGLRLEKKYEKKVLVDGRNYLFAIKAKTATE